MNRLFSVSDPTIVHQMNFYDLLLKCMFGLLYLKFIFNENTRNHDVHLYTKYVDL